ncbi:MAG: peptidase C39 family protein [Sandaracinaceae bacterium]|nr:peptidase C39 family protein [Sandaracinaceae bacterium]
MPPKPRWLLLLLALTLPVGCDSRAPTTDAGSAEDAAMAQDATTPDAGDDAAIPPTDAGAPALASRFVEWRGDALGAFESDHASVDAVGATIAASGGLDGSDGAGAFTYAELVSPEVEVAQPFREAVPSWNADTPPNTWVEIRMRARVAGAWTTEYVLGVWAAGEERFARHSVDGQRDATGTVATDTLRLDGAADAFQLRVRLASGAAGATPTLWGIGVSTSDPGATPPALAPDDAGYGMPLDVPTRSQMIYPDGGEVWCSPTSTTMVLAYWSREAALPELTLAVPDVAGAVWDDVYDGAGNWPFNTAFAAHASGGALRAIVSRLWRVEQLERLTAAGVPVIISISFASGELSGGPIRSTNGHLLVVRGFDASGDVLVNDPAGPADAMVRYTYDRAELDAAWAHSGRTAYIIHPADRPLPTEGSLGAW